jgi:hypothetical protein
MQAAKNKRLLLSLITLVVITLVVYFYTRADGQLALDKGMFQVEDQTKIDRVVMQSAQEKIEVSYDGTSWKVNNIYLADRKLVKVLFATLLQVVPKRPIGERIKDSISTSLTSGGVHVSLYVGSELVKSFFVGANSDRTQTYFQQDGNKPYLVTIPGYRVDASQIFGLDEGSWRDKRVFNFNWRNLKDITVTYSQEVKDNFVIDLQQKLLSIQGVALADTTRLSNFVEDLYTLSGDQLIKRGINSHTDSLFTSSPAFRVEVTDIAGRNYSLTVLSWKHAQTQLSAIVNDSVSMLFDKSKIFRIAKTKEYFKKRE